jgi:predicted DNA-binding transcriptional regulator AlpA
MERTEDDRRIVSLKRAVEIAGLSEMTWLRLQRLGDTPPVVRLSKHRVGYMLADVIAWLEARKEPVR